MAVLELAECYLAVVIGKQRPEKHYFASFEVILGEIARGKL